MMDTGSGDKFNADNDLYLPPTDSFWEVWIHFLKNKFFVSILFHHRLVNIVEW
jgi:hypothetical protein